MACRPAAGGGGVAGARTQARGRGGCGAGGGGGRGGRCCGGAYQGERAGEGRGVWRGPGGVPERRGWVIKRTGRGSGGGCGGRRGAGRRWGRGRRRAPGRG